MKNELKFAEWLLSGDFAFEESTEAGNTYTSVTLRIINKTLPELYDIFNRDKYNHAKKIVNKLLSRPHVYDEDGACDMIADEKQMVEIIKEELEKYG